MKATVRHASGDLATLEDALAIAHATVWAVMTTVDAKGRPRNRVVHPVWTLGDTIEGWLTTRVTPIKARHLAANPHVSIAYLAANTDAAFFDCVAEWIEDAAGKQRCWDAFLAAPEPARYDPATIWPAGPAEPTFAALHFQPYRVQALRAADVAKGIKRPPVRIEK